MDIGLEVCAENLEENANVFSRIFFLWTIPFFKRLRKNPLQKSDLFKIADDDNSENLCTELEEYWNNEISLAKCEKRKPTFSYAIRRMIWKKAVPCFIINMFHMALVKPAICVLLAQLIALFTEKHSNVLSDKLIVGTWLVVCSTAYAFLVHIPRYQNMKLGMRISAATSSLIYKKSLKLSLSSLEKISVGKIVNILSNDVRRLDTIPEVIEHLAACPLQLLTMSVLVWLFIGPPAIAGILFISLIVVPLQVSSAKLASSYQKEAAFHSDIRITLLNEIISGIKVIKMHAWERPIEELVNVSRKLELNHIFKYLNTQLFFYLFVIQKFSTYLSVTAIFLTMQTISAAMVFSCSQYLTVARTSMLAWFPRVLVELNEFLYVSDRITNYLMMDEHVNETQLLSLNKKIQLDKVTASWSSDSNFKLCIDQVHIESRTLCAIVGPVGSGKSALLNLLLGELTSMSGNMKINGSISYCSQEPWLFSSSIRNNILFGQKYHDMKYKSVVKACCLETDFKQFIKGDLSRVGENGMVLSGGQKARINLARAIYRDADIYLLDDPLSAVDTEVGRHLFQKCIVEYLKGKTRLLVTHQLQYLDRADQILSICKGKVQVHRNLEDLKERNFEFNSFIKENNAETDKLAYESGEKINDAVVISTSTTKSSEFLQEVTISKEKAMLEYLKSGSLHNLIVAGCCLLLTHILLGASDFWLVIWCRKEAFHTDEHEAIQSIDQTNGKNISQANSIRTNKSNLDLIIYSSLIFPTILLIVLANIQQTKFFMRASRTLHEEMVHRCLRAPLSFYYTNHIGRILNRFSSDVKAVDEFFPAVLKETLLLYIISLSAIVLMIVSNWYIVSFVIAISLTFFWVFNIFTTSSKQLKRLEIIAKSPVLSFLNYSLLGITTLRSNKAEAILEKQFNNLVNTHTSAKRLCVVCTFSFAMWLELICSSFVTCTVYSFILLSEYANTVDASLVGLGIYQALQLSGTLQFGVRKNIDVIYNMISVERVVEYTNLSVENSTKSKGILPLNWPDEGRIEFKNVSMSYSSEKLILKGITFVINAKEKIGVVGRTGAGKSSLIAALFYLNEYNGVILIDGVNIKTIEKENLRKNMSIIPQDPVLFSGSIRQNLDPFGKFTDDDLWSVLEEVGLKIAVSSLGMMVTESGNNFSTGEKQMICLARAILKKNKIVVLDEATANVDHRTDELIQQTIKKKLCDCTIITIAHRLNTIMDSDKVLVMDMGKIVEFDHAHRLIAKRGTFFSLVMETGETISHHLRNIARQHYLQIQK